MATNIYITADDISKVTKAKLDNVEIAWENLIRALDWCGINKPYVQIGMAATVAVETGSFLPIKEKKAKPDTRVWELQSKYWDTGFMGRGYIQLTHERNYRAAEQVLNVGLLNNPELLMQPEISAKAAAWFFKHNGIQLNCDRQDWAGVRRKVNGPNFMQNADCWDKFLRYCLDLSDLLNKGAIPQE